MKFAVSGLKCFALTIWIKVLALTIDCLKGICALLDLQWDYTQVNIDWHDYRVIDWHDYRVSDCYILLTCIPMWNTRSPNILCCFGRHLA